MVRNRGEVGLAGGPGGQEPGVMASGDVSSGFWIMSTKTRSATMTMFSWDAMVETRSEVVEGDMFERTRLGGRKWCLSRDAGKGREE